MARNQAIVIGINDYEWLQPLRYAKHDAQAVQDFLLSEASFDRVFFFADDSLPINDKPTKPSRTNLLKVLREIFEKPFMGDGDNFWFFFSGHGIRHADRDYLMPSDGDPENVEDTGISTYYITDRLRRCGADNVVVILDACRNQGRKSGEGIGRQTWEEARRTGVVSIFSCSPNQYSHEIETLQKGAFTTALLEGLSILGKCATVKRLDKYLGRRVPEIVRQHHHSRVQQIPYIAAEPIDRAHLILMPQYANQTDISNLENDALDAEANDKLELAEQLWIRVLAAPSGHNMRAIRAIQRIGNKRLRLEQTNVATPLNQKTTQESVTANDTIAFISQEIIEIFYLVTCIVQGYSEPILVKNTIQLLLKDLAMYRKVMPAAQSLNEESFLETWVKGKLDKIVKPLLLNRRYIDILTNFEPIALAIKERMQAEAASIGFSAEHIVSVASLKHLELRRDFVLEDPEEPGRETEEDNGTPYLTNDANVKVKLNTTVTARIENFETIAEYLSPDIEIKDLMKEAIRSSIKKYLNQVIPERYYMRFYYAGVDEQGNPIETKSVEQELKEAITKTLKDRFGAEIISVVPRPVDTPIVKHYRELRGRVGAFQFEVIPLSGGDPVRFYAEFQILGIEKNSWHIFQERMESMQRSQESRRMELERIKERYAREVSRNLGDDAQDLTQMQEQIRIIEEELSSIDSIRKAIESSVQQKLSSSSESAIAHTDSRDLKVMEEVINTWAREAIKNSYGLKIVIQNLHCNHTSKERLEVEDSQKEEDCSSLTSKAKRRTEWLESDLKEIQQEITRSRQQFKVLSERLSSIEHELNTSAGQERRRLRLLSEQCTQERNSWLIRRKELEKEQLEIEEELNKRRKNDASCKAASDSLLQEDQPEFLFKHEELDEKLKYSVIQRIEALTECIKQLDDRSDSEKKIVLQEKIRELKQLIGEDSEKPTDIYLDISLNADEMLYGTQRRIELEDGTINVKVPPGLSPGKRIRVRGKGNVDPETRQRGDLYLLVVDGNVE